MDFIGRYNQSIPVRRLKGGGSVSGLEEAHFGSNDPSQILLSESLKFLGKVVKRVVAEQLQVFLDDTSILVLFHLTITLITG